MAAGIKSFLECDTGRVTADEKPVRQDADELFRHIALLQEQNQVRAAQLQDTYDLLGRILEINEQRSGAA